MRLDDQVRSALPQTEDLRAIREGFADITRPMDLQYARNMAAIEAALWPGLLETSS